MKRLSKCDKFCHHLHISLQSGSTDILLSMNRTYTRKVAVENLEYLLREMNDFVFTCDVIVGFPGETNQDYLDTYSFVEKFPFYHVHVFKFSKRKGTNAEKMKNQIDRRVMDNRSHKLLELSKKKKMEIANIYIGLKIDVIFENEDKQEIGYLKGHSRNYIECLIRKEELEVKDEISVVVQENKQGVLITSVI